MCYMIAWNELHIQGREGRNAYRKSAIRFSRNYWSIHQWTAGRRFFPACSQTQIEMKASFRTIWSQPWLRYALWRHLYLFGKPCSILKIKSKFVFAVFESEGTLWFDKVKTLTVTTQHAVLVVNNLNLLNHGGSLQISFPRHVKSCSSVFPRLRSCIWPPQ